MKKIQCLIIFIIFTQTLNAQSKTFKCEKVHDAIQLIDEEKYDEGIAILKDCEKIDPKDSTYPYEIAYALTSQKEYKKAIEQLEKIRNYDNIDDYYFSLLGSNYDYIENPTKAIAVYDEGLKKFPNSGKLYLEKGVALEYEKKFSEAIRSYEKGIEVQPSYPSNYYRAANLYLESNYKVAGLIYGEIFINLERTTERTKEMSKKLYNFYKNAFVLKDSSEKSVQICNNYTMTPENLKKGKLPYCMIFEKNLLLGVVDQHTFDLNSFSEIRNMFLKQYLSVDYKNYPNVLINYFKLMQENKVFNAYNHYAFQMGETQTFNKWLENNKDEYEKFVEWYTSENNILKIDKTNIYISDMY